MFRILQGISFCLFCLRSFSMQKKYFLPREKCSGATVEKPMKTMLPTQKLYCYFHIYNAHSLSINYSVPFGNRITELLARYEFFFIIFFCSSLVPLSFRFSSFGVDVFVLVSKKCGRHRRARQRERDRKRWRMKMGKEKSIELHMKTKIRYWIAKQ